MAGGESVVRHEKPKPNGGNQPQEEHDLEQEMRLMWMGMGQDPIGQTCWGCLWGLGVVVIQGCILCGARGAKRDSRRCAGSRFDQ